jgi:IS30 family transposase
MEYLSIKEIADSLGVNKQKVYRCIKANHINEAVIEAVKGNNVLKYDKQAVERIKQLLNCCTDNSESVSNEAPYEARNDTVIEALLKQLDIKDKQIAELNERLAEVNRILEQQQKLNALDKQQILQIESRQEDVAQEVVHADERLKKGFWRNFFRR